MVQIQDNVPPDPKKVEAQKDAAVKQSLGKIKNKIIVMSGKGGVGKTSTSVNLAIALANSGHKVGLMDVDLHGPDVPRMLGIEGMPQLTANNKVSPLRYSDNLSAISIESFIPSKDDAIIWRGPLKFSAIRQFIGDVEWGDLDFLVIDSPPGTGDEPLTVAQMISDAMAIIVTTPQEVALADVRKSINFCKAVKMEIFGLIENMSGFHCPHCGELIELFGSGGGERTAKEMAIRFLGRIPFDPEVVACGDSGACYQQIHKDSAVAKAFSEVSRAVAALVQR
jgi:ATP-binding protein involved in chromosome partitioning